MDDHVINTHRGSKSEGNRCTGHCQSRSHRPNLASDGWRGGEDSDSSDNPDDDISGYCDETSDEMKRPMIMRAKLRISTMTDWMMMAWKKPKPRPKTVASNQQSSCAKPPDLTSSMI